MSQLNLTEFLQRYFKANDCTITIKENNILSVKLTEEMDKAIMNRPFYWQYVQATNQVGEPMTLSLYIADHNNENNETEQPKDEHIHFGSARLHTIFQQLNESAQFVRLFEKVNNETNTMLYPWLVINIVVSFKGKQKKEQLFSIGLQLINGIFVLNMMEQLEKVSLSEHISNYCYTISPLIMEQSGYKRIENKVLQLIQNKCYKWAVHSIEALQEEIKLINHFYEQSNEQHKLQKEIDEAKSRYEPTITIKPFSGGLFYLTDSFLNN